MKPIDDLKTRLPKLYSRNSCDHDLTHIRRVVKRAQIIGQRERARLSILLPAAMLHDIGAKSVILGHSERRHILGETDEDVNKKTVAALAAGIRPIVCVGELLEQREAGKTAEVIRGQFDGSLAGISADAMKSVVIAYEPVWAIGTGKVATPEQAEEVHADLRKQLVERYNTDVAETVRILYGGSVKPDNAAELLGQPNIDGALIGGASLKADDFLAIALASIATVQA